MTTITEAQRRELVLRSRTESLTDEEEQMLKASALQHFSDVHKAQFDAHARELGPVLRDLIKRHDLRHADGSGRFATIEDSAVAPSAPAAAEQPLIPWQHSTHSNFRRRR